MADAYTITTTPDGKLKVTRTATAAEKNKQKGKAWSSLTTKEQVDYIAAMLGIVGDDGKVKST